MKKDPFSGADEAPKSFMEQLREKAKSELRPISVAGISCYARRASQAQISRANAVADSVFVRAVRFANPSDRRTDEKILSTYPEQVSATRMIYVATAFLCDAAGNALYETAADMEELANAVVTDAEAVKAITAYIEEHYPKDGGTESPNVIASDSEAS